MIVTTDDDILPSDNVKQFGNSLIVMLNVSLPSCIVSLMIVIANGDDCFESARTVASAVDSS